MTVAAPSHAELLSAVDDLFLHATTEGLVNAVRPSTVETCRAVHEFMLAAADPQVLGGLVPAEDPGLLTPAEHLALELSGALGRALRDIVGEGRDLDEFHLALHAIQRSIGAQAAARAYPSLYRLLTPPPEAVS